MLISLSNQIWVALKQYKKFPHTFTYLFAYFLLADVRVVLIIYIGVKLTYSGDLPRPGLEHNQYTGVHLSE